MPGFCETWRVKCHGFGATCKGHNVKQNLYELIFDNQGVQWLTIRLWNSEAGMID